MTQLNRLSSAFVKSAPHGKHSDGQGLWLIKRPDGGAQWVLRISLRGKRREMGLGSANDVSLKEARELASEYRKLAKQGIDPINFRLTEKRALLKPGKSLAEIATAAYEAKKAELKNDGINARWFSPLQLHVLPKLGKISVEDITQQDIAEALQPIWHQKAATAKKAIAFSLQRVELGLDDEFDPITSCVVEHLDIDVASIKSSRKLKGNQKIAMQALHDAVAKHGRKMADTENYPASRDVVEKSQWRTAFLKIRIDSDVKAESVKRDFERQSQKLQEDGFIHCFEDKVWIIHDEDRQDI